MTVPFTQPKPTFVEVVDFTNIGAGAPVQLTNMPPGVLGFEGGGDPYRVYAPGTLLYARTDGPLTPGGLFLVAEDTAGSPVAIQIVRGSEPSGTGALLLYVVAEAGTPMAVTGTYPTVAAAITAAVAARGAATVPVDILVLPGTYAGFALQANVHVKALTEGRSGQTAQATTTVNSAISFVASGAACAASLGSLQVSTGAVTALDGTNAANYVVTVQNCRLVNNDAAAAVIDPVAGEYALYGTQIEAQGGSATIASSTATLSLSECQLTGPTNLGGIHAAANTTFSGVVSSSNGSTTFSHCTIRANNAAGALQLAGTANSTLISSTVDNANNALTVGGAAGTLAITGGTTGIRTVAAGITVNVTQPLGAAYRRQNIAATATIADDTDVAVINLAVAGVITLPDPNLQLPDKELVIKRNDSNIVSCSITPPPGIEIDTLGAAVPVLLNPQGDYLRLRADRSNSRWNRC